MDSTRQRGRLAWTLLLGCGRIEARRYSNLCDGLSDDAQKIRDDARRTFRADDCVRQKVRDAQIVRCVTALARSRNNEVSNGANRSAVAACFLYALPSELEAFACFEKLAELCPRYFTPTLDGCVVGAALVDHILRCISPDIHATLLGDSLLLDDDARTPVEDLVAYPLLASLFTCVPPLDEVAVLWDATFALGGHFPVLCVVALILERFESGDKTVARRGSSRGAGAARRAAHRKTRARACAVAPRARAPVLVRRPGAARARRFAWTARPCRAASEAPPADAADAALSLGFFERAKARLIERAPTAILSVVTSLNIDFRDREGHTELRPQSNLDVAPNRVSKSTVPPASIPAPPARVSCASLRDWDQHGGKSRMRESALAIVSRGDDSHCPKFGGFDHVLEGGAGEPQPGSPAKYHRNLSAQIMIYVLLAGDASMVAIRRHTNTCTVPSFSNGAKVSKTVLYRTATATASLYFLSALYCSALPPRCIFLHLLVAAAPVVMLASRITISCNTARIAARCGPVGRRRRRNL